MLRRSVICDFFEVEIWHFGSEVSGGAVCEPVALPTVIPAFDEEAL